MPLDDKPSVSVIITCYNLERYIGLAIQSALDQVQQADEIIVVDDASTDRSSDAISRFGDRIKSIRIDRNLGVLNATLKGIAISTGDIIAFLDGDDLWRSNKLDYVTSYFLNSSRLVLLSHNYAIIDGDGVPTHETDATMINTQRLVKKNLSLEAMSDALKCSMLSYRGVWLGSAFAIRRSALDLSELERFIASISIPDFRRLSYQDHLIAQFVVVTRPDGLVGFVDEVLFDYRIFSGNTSGLAADRESALKTLARGHANVLGTQLLLHAFPRYRPQMRRQARMAKEFRYMTALYTGSKLRAGAMAISLSITYWQPKQIVKELVRTMTIACLGIDRFFLMKKHRRFKNAPPPS